MSTLADLFPAYGARIQPIGAPVGSLGQAGTFAGLPMGSLVSLLQQHPPQGGGGGRPVLPPFLGQGPPQAPPSQAPPSTGSRVTLGRDIYNYFLGQGLSPHQAAALAGNMAWEGGGRVDLVNPNDNPRNSPMSPHSLGIAQWNDRAPALLAFARAQGVDIPTGDLRDVGYARSVIQRIPLQTQLAFAWQEMQGPERRAFSALTAAPDLRTATAGAIGYHRPAGFTWANPYAGHGFDNRFSLAQQILGY